jgi:hypothetical protein
MKLERKIEIVDGVAYMVTKQELSKEQLEKIKANQVAQKVAIEANIAGLDAKIPLVTAKPVEIEKEIEKEI